MSSSLAQQDDGLPCTSAARKRFRSVYGDDGGHAMSTWTSSEQSTVRRQLLQEYDALTALSYEILSRANDLSPIASIPLEVFLAIASLVASQERPWPPRGEAIPGSEEDDEDAEDSSDRRKPATLGWIRLTHVSSGWRRKLLAYPVIWGRDIGLLPAVLTTMLERAGDSTPIDLTFRHRSVDRAQLITSTEIQPTRIRSICWEVGELSLVANMLSGKQYPALETLRVQPHYDYGRYGSFQSTLPTLHAPQLRRLEFFGFFVPFVAPQLTSLELYGIDEVDAARDLVSISFTTFMNFLAASPLLEEIIFTGYDHGWALPGPCKPSHDVQPLVLPHLRFLELEMYGPAWQVDYALRYLALPPRTHFSLYHRTINTDDDFELLATVARFLCQGTPPRELRLEWESLSLGAGLDQEHGHNIGGASFGSFALDRLAHKLPTLGISALLEGVTILTILPQFEDTTASYWPAMFQCLPNVTMLVLGCSNAREQLWAGTLPSNETKPGLIRILDTLIARPRPVFPRLRHLRIAPNVRPTWLPLSTIHSCLRRRTFKDVHVLDILDLPSYHEPTIPIQSQFDLHHAGIDFSGLAKHIIWRQPGAVEKILSKNRLRILLPAGTPL